jgi:hypothetical protein
MEETCAKCGREREGQHYSFYYGRKLGPSVKQEDLSGRKFTITTRHQVLGSSEAFICDDCVLRSARERGCLYVVGGLGLAGSLLACGLLPLFTSSRGVDAALIKQYVVPPLLLSLVSLPFILAGLTGLLKKRPQKTNGEKVAIAAMRQQLGQREGADTFWTSKQYAPP